MQEFMSSDSLSVSRSACSFLSLEIKISPCPSLKKSVCMRQLNSDRKCAPQRCKDGSVRCPIACDNPHILGQPLAVAEIKSFAMHITRHTTSLRHKEGARRVVPDALAVGATEEPKVRCRFASSDKAVLNHAVKKQRRSNDGEGGA